MFEIYRHCPIMQAVACSYIYIYDSFNSKQQLSPARGAEYWFSGTGVNYSTIALNKSI